MRYWEEQESGPKKEAKKPITREDVLNTLAYIKRGHMPDWNYERRGDVSLPNEYYPLHVAMNVAVRAVQAMDDDFFEAMNREYDAMEAKMGTVPIYGQADES